MSRKYAVHPGYVISQSDGDRHYISSRQLMDLYGVSPEECYTVPMGYDSRFLMPVGITHLYPRESGDYRLPPPTGSEEPK